MSYLTGKKLIKKAGGITPNGVLEYSWDSRRVNVIAGVRRGNIWFYERECMGDTDDRMTHGCIDSDIHHIVANKMSIKEFRNFGIKCSKKKLSKKQFKDILEDNCLSIYNFRYYKELKCLTFWGYKSEVNFAIIGELIGILGIADEELTVAFFEDEEDGKDIHLAKDLNLITYQDKEITSLFSRLSSSMLHMIACKKKTFDGLGSRKLKCGMPLTKYKQLKITSE
jgi:hypothetical protein